MADSPLPTRPRCESIPTLDDGTTGVVVWHRTDLRIADNPALAAATGAWDGEARGDKDDDGEARGDEDLNEDTESGNRRILPLFVFDPAFYVGDGRVGDARIGFLHDCLRDLDEQYRDVGGPGLTYGHGDPIVVLRRFVDAGWAVYAGATPSGPYGTARDDRARDELGVRFVGGDGLVRGETRPRRDWGDRTEAWLAGEPFRWDPGAVDVVTARTAVNPERIAAAYDVSTTKSMVPTGGRSSANEHLSAFVSRVGAYPGNVSSPVDAREGTSGLSPYLRFGCLSVREVHRHLESNVPDGRGKSMFVSRLYWNLHYRQKLVDWPGWVDRAVNPVMRGFNRDRHDPALVEAWKTGETGFPMIDASMRCLRETGWLNFRTRAMCASLYYHVLQQPWRIGADHFYEHLIDGDAAINYTQWQSQCGLVGRPGLRLYNPAKGVRDLDSEGVFITRWVPELADFPVEHLPNPAKAPLAAQDDCGVRIGEDYPYPVVDYEAARLEFRDHYAAVQPRAAARLADETIARRASLSGGIDGARSIAGEHGAPTDAADGSVDNDPGGTGTQTGLDEF